MEIRTILIIAIIIILIIVVAYYYYVYYYTPAEEIEDVINNDNNGKKKGKKKKKKNKGSGDEKYYEKLIDEIDKYKDALEQSVGDLEEYMENAEEEKIKISDAIDIYEGDLNDNLQTLRKMTDALNKVFRNYLTAIKRGKTPSAPDLSKPFKEMTQVSNSFMTAMNDIINIILTETSELNETDMQTSSINAQDSYSKLDIQFKKLKKAI